MYLLVPADRTRLALAAFICFCAVAAKVVAAPSGLVLWNRLGSEYQVLNSSAGSNGLAYAGSFVPGVFGNALQLSALNSNGVKFPSEIFPTTAGCVEFWAKGTDLGSTISWGNRVILFGVEVPDGTVYPIMHFNGNDGAANGGLCGRLGGVGSCGTGSYGSWTYSSVLNGGALSDWHHYALSWSVDGVPGLTSPVRRMAIFIDGQLNTGSWIGEVLPPGASVMPQNSKLVLLRMQDMATSGSLAIDNVKMWNYPKADFSDRFVEGPDNVTYSLSVSGALGQAWPTNGIYTFAAGENLSACVAPTFTQGSVRLLCSGASVSGNAFTQVGPANVTLTITNNAALMWNWDTNYWVEVSATGNGSASGSGWYTAGTNIVLTATPDSGYQFAGWSDGILTASRSISVPQGGGSYIASFSLIPRGVVRFAKTSYTVAENATVVKLTVERAEGTYGSVSVSYANTDGTAVKGSDYDLEINTLSWKDGEAGTKSLYVDILDDTGYEGNEHFSVRLADVTGASLGTPSAATVTIVDDEAAPVRIPRFVGVTDFGNVPTNRVSTQTIQVWNDGNQTLSVTNVIVPDRFSATPTNFTVPAGEAVTLSVSFAPAALSSYSGILTLLCNATTGTASVAVSGTGVVPQPCSAMRTISGLTAMIAVVVPEQATALGIQEELAAGITPVVITDGGSWDAANRKVKWFFSEPGQIRNRVLQYSVDCAGSVVGGCVNFGGGNMPVCGDTAFTGDPNPGLLHPADDNGDWRIVLDEVAASVTRWRNGTDNTATPIVIRGITLYLKGELYRYNASVSSEAKRWEPLAAFATENAKSASRDTAGKQSVLQTGAVRTISSTNVMIAVTPAEGTLAWGMEEVIPENVEVSWISENGTWDDAHRKIKWSFFDGSARNLSYNLAGTAGACVSVAGTISFDGSEEPVTGSSVASLPLPFTTWMTQRGMSGAPDVAFCAPNAGNNQPNGLVYAFQNNLQADEPLITILIKGGVPIIETPRQVDATLPYVTIEVIGSTSPTGGEEWSLSAVPASDQSDVPDNRCRWVPATIPDKAFYRIRATLK